MKLILLLLITSCANQPNNRVFYVKKEIIGVKCPINSFYSFKTEMCTLTKAMPKKRQIKPLVNCQTVFNQANKCMSK